MGFLFLLPVLFFLFRPAYSAEPVLRFSFNDDIMLDAVSSARADTGVFISARRYSTAPENIHEGAGSLLLSFRNSEKRQGEWKLKLGAVDGIKVTKYSFWMKSVLGKTSLNAGLIDTERKVILSTVKVTDNKWQKYEIEAGPDAKAAVEFLIGFSSQTAPGHFFIDEIEFYGRRIASPGNAGKKEAVPAEPDAKSGKKTDAQEKLSLSTWTASGYTGNPPIAQLIRPFKRTDKDLKAVSDMLLQAARNDPGSSKDMTDEQFMDLIEQRAFLFFWYEANPETGVTLDRGRCFETTGHKVGSNASVGHMLTAMCIGHSRGWITYEQAYERVLKTLKFHRDKTKNVEGFYYHFVDIETGERVWSCELSTIDTCLFLCGVIMSMEYFKGTEVEKVANDIYMRVNWRWAHQSSLGSTSGGKFASMGWSPEKGFIDAAWNRYCESLFIAVLELGHPTANIDKSVWYDIEKNKGTYKGFECISQTGPLFGYQYQHLWFDFRNKTDGFANHFEISTNETLANRQYAIDLMDKRKGYGPDSWGFSACDGPGGYAVYAAPPGPPGEDGTICPTAPGGSFAFTPKLSLKALRYMYDTWRDKVWGKYGFCDAYNIERNWFAGDNIGIDQGPFLLAIENHRTGMVWKYTMQNKYIQAAFRKIGFQNEPRADAKVLPLDLSGDDWLFSFGDKLEFSKTNYDDSGWRRIYVPDKWENQLLKQFDGTAWYRKHFRLSSGDIESWKGKRITLHLGGVDDKDEAYLNGTRIGARAGWEFERVYSVDPKLLNPDGDNVIAVRVTDISGDGGIWIRPVEIGPHIPYDWKPFKKP